MRASLVTDVAQSVACVGFLIALVIVLGINAPSSFGSWNPAGMHTGKTEQKGCVGIVQWEGQRVPSLL